MELNFILQIVLVLAAVKIAGHISVRLGQPSVLGKIIVGILLGPAVLGWVHPSEVLDVFSHIGVLLLMFLAGLETDLKDLRENVKAALLVAAGGVIAPIAMSYWTAQLFGFTPAEALFLGLLLSATSVSISVQTLREIGWLNTKEGSALLGAAVLDDIIVIILIAVAAGFLGTGSGAETSVGLLMAKIAAFFIALLLASKWVIPYLVKWFSALKVTQAVLSAGFIIAFALAYFAEYLSVAGIIGAFFAGVALKQTKYGPEIAHHTETAAYGIFVPFFFVSIGLAMSFDGIGNQLWFLALFSLIAVISKIAGSGLGAKLSGFSARSSLGIGSGMVSRGEVALILAAMGLKEGLLNPAYYTSAIFIVILTTVVTPPLLKMIFGTREEETAPLAAQREAAEALREAQ